MTKYFACFFILLLGSHLKGQNELQNLVVFAKAYGYVKYFHPSDECVDIDWNKFSAFGAQKVSNSKNSEELIKTLNELFHPIAPAVKFTSNNEEEYNFESITPKNADEYMLMNWQHQGLAFGQHPHQTYQSIRICQPGYTGLRTKKNTLGRIFADYPEFGTLIDKEIGPSIYCKIPITLYSSTIGSYPYSDKYIDFEKELNQLSENLGDINVRLGNLINVYNVFQHFYPYFDVVDLDWEAEFKSAITRSYKDNTEKDHLITLQKFTAPLRDGHIFILDGKKEWYTPSFNWELIEDQLVITDLFDDSTDLKIGDIVSKVNGISSAIYFQEIKSRISAGTESYLNYIAKTSSILGKKNSTITIEVNGKTLKLKRSHYSVMKNSEIMKYSYKHLDDNIMYLDLTRIKMNEINQLLPQLQQAKAIICDGRGYIQSKRDFLRYLLTKRDTSSSWLRVPRVIYPDREKSAGYKTYGWELEPKAPYLGDKKIVFLINGKAVSSSESFLSFVEHYDLGMLVGEPTAGTNGAATSFSLLGDITVRWTGTKVVKHDGSQHHGIGILPDVYVSKTIDGLKAGKDEYLHKAIQILQEE